MMMEEFNRWDGNRAQQFQARNRQVSICNNGSTTLMYGPEDSHGGEPSFRRLDLAGTVAPYWCATGELRATSGFVIISFWPPPFLDYL